MIGISGEQICFAMNLGTISGLRHLLRLDSIAGNLYWSTGILEECGSEF